MSAPLYVDGEFYGIINVDNIHDENAFNKKDIRLIQYIARQLEMTIKNALLVNELLNSLRIDSLTGIYNRRYFEEIVEEKIKSSEISKEKLALVMIDMDNFKAINDNFGHKVGDEVLKFFARTLLDNIGNNNIVARFAGDEFVILLHDMNRDEIETLVNKIRNEVGKYYNDEIKIEFSTGICMFKDGMNMDKLLIHADKCMYQEKKKKKRHGL